MSIRLPLQAVLSDSQGLQTGGPTSILGGRALPFTLPQDTDNVVVKFQASVKTGGASAVFQTSDDGGTTWYDVQRTSIVSDAALPEWLSIPVATLGIRSATLTASVVATGSVFTSGSIFTTIGATSASTLGQKEVSGLPILSPYNRIFIRYTAAITSVISESVTVSANSQSATA